MSEVAQLTRSVIDRIRAKAAQSPSLASAPLGVPCPVCNSEVTVQRFDYKCASCEFKLPRVLLTRPITIPEAEALMRDKALPVLEGFVSAKSGKKFSAPMVLTDTGKWEFVFDGGDGASAGPKGDALPVPCPVCNGTIHEQSKMYACEKGDFKLWNEVAGKLLKPSTAAKLIRERELPMSDGFTGKNGKFSAGLKLLKPDAQGVAKVEFVFPPRR